MFSSLMSPIHELNKANKPFAWTERADRAFQKIKKRLSSPPVISFPGFSRMFTLNTDASDVACGAILMQEADNRKKNIIAVASRTFKPTEQDWSTTEREAYAIKWAILKFDYFLRNCHFIFTDHRSLNYLDQREFNNAKIRRWQEEISCYKFLSLSSWRSNRMYGLTCSAEVADTRRRKHAATKPQQAKHTS